jgi:hypothetical protein
MAIPPAMVMPRNLRGTRPINIKNMMVKNNNAAVEKFDKEIPRQTTPLTARIDMNVLADGGFSAS